ncbi:MAG TPA: hypothetical protein VKA84_27480, partial [Gemmatimonadaceae bacterium]|nr:hypothetical protein [Gemmatimonadaceae bacterium]
AAARTPPGDLRRFAGSYRWTRNARRSAEKVLSLATDVRVRVRGDSLALEALVPLPAEGWRRVGPLRFERGADGHYLAFREDERGHVSHLFLDIAGDHFAFERVPWTRTPGVQLTLFALPMAVLLSFPVARSAAGAARRLRRAAPAAPHGRRADGPPAIAAHAAALAAAAFTGGTLAVLANARELAYGPTPLLRVVLAVPIALAALSALLVYFAAAAWGRRQWSLPSRLYYTTVAAAAAALVAWLQAYDLLGYHL